MYEITYAQGAVVRTRRVNRADKVAVCRRVRRHGGQILSVREAVADGSLA